MEIKTESLKRCELLTVSGRVDSAHAPELETMLIDLIEAGQRNLVVNLGDVTFISSAGLKALLTAQIKVRRRLPRGSVAISETSEELMGTFQLVGLDRLFDFYESDLEAVGSF
ncbi:MAG: STAS domain-containing protein [Anaerolineae bacterium]|jgi:anti-sigma B factor antagonist